MSELNESEIELSAYLDGEAESPAEIAALLHRDPAAARRVAELRDVSARVRALPAPGASPAFVSRVMARLDAPATAVHRPRLRVLAPVLAFAATAAIVSGVVWWLRTTPSPAPVVQVVHAPDTHRWQNDEEVLAALEQLAESGEDLSLFETDVAAIDVETEELAANAALEYLASVVWPDVAQAPIAIEESLDFEMNQLSDEDFNDLQDWLVANPRGGRTS